MAGKAASLPAAGTPTKSHDDQRQSLDWVDQHGRPWSGTIELKSRDFCGLPPQPSGWAPPFVQWSPPPRCLRLNTVRGRMDLLMIDYDIWLADLREKHAQYNMTLYDVGHEFHGSMFDAANPSAKVQREMGPRPLAIEVVIAMKQGNRSALGWDVKSGTPYIGPLDPRLEAFKPFTLATEDLDFRDVDLSDEPVVSKSGRQKVGA